MKYRRVSWNAWAGDVPSGAVSQAGPLETTYTSESGMYAFDDLEHGEYMVVMPNLEGYEPTTDHEVLVIVAPGQTYAVNFGVRMSLFIVYLPLVGKSPSATTGEVRAAV